MGLTGTVRQVLSAAPGCQCVDLHGFLKILIEDLLPCFLN